MTDQVTSYETRLTNLDGHVRSLSSEMGGVKAQLHTLGTGQDAIFSKLESMGNKMENSRPGIAAIWAPLSVMTAILLGVGGIVSKPYTDRIRENAETIVQHEGKSERRDEAITRLRIRMAVLEDRSSKPVGGIE